MYFGFFQQLIGSCGIRDILNMRMKLNYSTFTPNKNHTLKSLQKTSLYGKLLRIYNLTKEVINVCWTSEKRSERHLVILKSGKI